MDKNTPREWWTLEQYAVSLFEENRTDSPEFKLLLLMFGREKLAEMFERFKGGKKLTELTRLKALNSKPPEPTKKERRK